MTGPAPEKAAPIPSVDILDGFRPEPAIDTAMFITPARMRFLVARATMPYSTADDVERSIREAIEDTVRVIKQHLADREARPSLPDSREERIREDERDRLCELAHQQMTAASSDALDEDEGAFAESFLRRLGAMHPADRARQRGDAS